MERSAATVIASALLSFLFAASAMAGTADQITLFLCGDVMTGRGIDQVLAHPGDPQLHESYVKDARDYVALAETAHGPIPRLVDAAYVWGDALAEWDRAQPAARIINLETSVTTHDAFARGKGIHYRMHPRNVACLAAARIDCCVLANNHVLDWGKDGLRETREVLRGAGIRTAGAGRDWDEAQAPAVIPGPGRGRVLVFGFGHPGSGIPRDWAAGKTEPGIHLMRDLSRATLHAIRKQIDAVRQPRDVVVASIHWGDNWGYRVPADHQRFAHWLIEIAGVDIVHGHSSHHVKGIEVYRGKLILYGCGDFLNDYEGIAGHRRFRGDLALMYFASVDPGTGKLGRLEMTPTRTKRFRVNRASAEEAIWLAQILNREGRALGTAVDHDRASNRLLLRW